MKKKEYIDAMNEIKASKELKHKVLDETNKIRGHKRIYSILATSAIAIVLALSIAIPLNMNRNKVTPIDAIEENGGLPTVGNFKNLYKLIKDNYKGYTNSTIGGISIDADVVTESAITSDSSTFKTAGESADYSKTNVQVEGVDEADIVKTDGSYIYYVTDENIVIVDARDSEKLKIISTIKYNRDNFYNQQIPYHQSDGTRNQNRFWHNHPVLQALLRNTDNMLDYPDRKNHLGRNSTILHQYIIHRFHPFQE